MNESGYAFRLCKTQNRKRGITTDPYHRMRPEVIHDTPDLEKTLYQFEGQSNIFHQRASVETSYIQPPDIITSLGYFFHFHLSLGTHKKDMTFRILFCQCIGNG